MRLIARMRMYPANTPPHIYKDRKREPSRCIPILRVRDMTKPTQHQNADEYADAGRRTGIPISGNHAMMAANSSDSLHDAIDLVRSLDYQDHEPSNVFNPVVLVEGSSEGSDR